MFVLKTDVRDNNIIGIFSFHSTVEMALLLTKTFNLTEEELFKIKKEGYTLIHPTENGMYSLDPVSGEYPRGTFEFQCLQILDKTKDIK